jgi:hypothetical protein
MIIKDTAWLERRKKKRTVASSGTVDRSTPGIEYAIIDARQGGDAHTVHEIDGEQVRLVNRLGLTTDRDLAQAAQAQGLQVIMREKAVAKFSMVVPEMPWKRKEPDGVT